MGLQSGTDEGSRPLFGMRGRPLEAQAAAIVGCIEDGLGLQARGGPAGRVLLDEALHDGGAHPTLLAVVRPRTRAPGGPPQRRRVGPRRLLDAADRPGDVSADRLRAGESDLRV